ncbi:MAG: hypothetical protein HFH68_02580 [Lachnospiraceae bacterium]|nr:hypothetical protein [Lachnospiraceae bacterium]
MSEERQLLVGIDLGRTISQISCFDSKLYEPVPIGRMHGKEREYEIPVAFAINRKNNEWLWGTDALEAGEDFIHLDNILERIVSTDKFEITGYTFHSKEVLKRFLLKELSLLKEYYPNDTIKKLVISTEDRDSKAIPIIKDACGELGIMEDRLVVQSHKQSYMYYAVSQPQELWINNVGMFEYNTGGLSYSQISIDRKNVPYIVGVDKKDLSDVMPYSILLENDDIRIKYSFTNVANTALHKQMVTTIYVTGTGFEGKWASDALKELCTGRRVFRGQNLFTKGACYAAREFAGQGKLEGFIFLDEDMITSDILIRTYHNAEFGEVALATAGSRWNEVDSSIDVIPDDEEEIQIITRNALLHEAKAHILSLNGFIGRKNKMTRFTVRIRFASKNTCIVTLKDNGFGEFCPSTNRIWERYIDI